MIHVYNIFLFSVSDYDASSVQNVCKGADLAVVCLGNGGRN